MAPSVAAHGTYSRTKVTIATAARGEYSARNAALKQDRIARVTARIAEIRELLAAYRLNRELYAAEIVPARERDFEIAKTSFESGRIDRIALNEARLRLLKSRADLLAIEERLTILVLEGLALLGLPPETWD